MTNKDEALKGVILDYKDKLKITISDYEYHKKSMYEHEIIMNAQKELIAHLESTAGWMQPLTIDNGDIGHIINKQKTKSWWKKILGVK